MKYLVQFWQQSFDDYDLFEELVETDSEEKAIEIAKSLNKKGKGFKIFKD